MSEQFFVGMGIAFEEGQKAAYEITTISNNSDMGDIREDATIEVIARLMKAVPRDMWGVALAETVKMLGVALAAYSDELQGRDPLNPTKEVMV